MNRVKNWSIVAAFFMFLAFVWITTQNTPYVAAILVAVGVLSAYMALIRYEDNKELYQ